MTKNVFDYQKILSFRLRLEIIFLDVQGPSSERNIYSFDHATST